MADYRRLIDPETWAFIERSDSFYPPDAASLSIEDNRKAYDAMCQALDAGRPEGVSTEDRKLEGSSDPLPVRLYRAARRDDAATVVYFHGGGFTLGGLESHDSVCAEICAGTGYDLMSVDYRLAPEHLHPAAFDDAMTAFRWAARSCDGRIVLAGDSAGGNLAAAVSHLTRGDETKPAAQVLIYPGLGGDTGSGSYVEHAEAPMLTLRDVETYRGVRSGGAAGTGEIALWPLADADFANLPPTFVVAAECDPLCSDAEAYGSRVVAAGGNAYWVVERGLVHGYLRARHSVGRARASFSRIVEATGRLGRGEWPPL
jgi:acetyl esterase